MNGNGATRGEAVQTRRDLAPRVHALRDAVREALFGEYPCDDSTADQLRRFDTILVFACVYGQEIQPEDEQYVLGLLWRAVMSKEEAA